MNELRKKCAFCQNGDDLPVIFKYSENIQEVQASIDKNKKELSVAFNSSCQLLTSYLKIKYCPICGRKLKSDH